VAVILDVLLERENVASGPVQLAGDTGHNAWLISAGHQQHERLH
jgi:hypothetical protein